MSEFLKQMIIKKLKQLTKDELLELANRYQFAITLDEAQCIIQYIQTNSIDPFSSHGRHKLILELTRITNEETAFYANELFIQMIKRYHLTHLFKD
ncbi:MAG TPA: DUF2624 domain-containing protein [Candidatus Avamphibacillus intestinigallinarum]|nr:DUF2624 domain-containing protein [Candidatus Avamphibacillus intestinigallinarum]